MSNERIRQAKQRQIEFDTVREETVALIKEQQMFQSQINLRIENTKTQIAEVHETRTNTELVIANTTEALSRVKAGAAMDTLNYETASRNLKQTEYRYKLEAQQINLAEIQAVNSHQIVINGNDIKLLPPSID